ncbi:MAG: SDR family NAD(P)-dependent oxidoreductase [Myxococcota bacterium]|nr:SDR family NAD(P)-dependent oxidoreductase [Myxococcota bacterium]
MDVRSLEGRVAVVTGAASGIGRATALAFAGRGADLALCDLDEAGLAGTAEAAEGMGRRALTRRVDVADAEAVAGFAAAVQAELGTPHLLMNNAGVGLGGGFLETSLEDWEWILGVNLKGVVHGCHAFLPRMVEAGGPRHVINVASLAAFVPSESLSAYVTSKFAVLGLTESLAIELRRFGIGATAICPGIIDTPITRSARLRGRAAADPAFRERMVETYRRRGYGPERVARAVLRAVQRDRVVAPVSPEAWFGYAWKRLLPGALRAFVGWSERRQMQAAPDRREA